MEFVEDYAVFARPQALRQQGEAQLSFLISNEKSTLSNSAQCNVPRLLTLRCLCVYSTADVRMRIQRDSVMSLISVVTLYATLLLSFLP